MSISSHSLLAYQVSAEKFADSLMGVILYDRDFFSLAAFKILSLSLILDSLIIIHLREVHFGLKI